MKLFYVCALAIVLPGMASGQKLGGNHDVDVERGDAGFGFKGGVNLSSLRGAENGYNTSGITSYHIGSYAKVAVSQKLALQLEAMYSRKGADYDSTTNSKSKLRFDYIDVPLLLSYNILGDNFTIQAGPQASLMLTAKDNGKEIDKTPFHTFDMSGVIGLQTGFSIFRFGARYNLGLRDVINHPDAAKTNSNLKNQQFKNNLVQVYAALEF